MAKALRVYGLEWLHRRFLLARDLLTEDGVILVNINDENRALLELMLDQTLPGMKIGSLVWRSRTGGNDPKGPFISINHEHVLAYGGKEFRFCGTEKTFEKYQFFDEAKNDWYRLDNITQPKDRLERPNGFYALRDPATDIYYPANPTRVWPSPYSKGIKKAEASSGEEFSTPVWPNPDIPIEEATDQIAKLMRERRINFPDDQVIKTWSTIEELQADIEAGEVPASKTTLKLWKEMPDLGFWVGKKIGFGTVDYRRYKSDLKNPTQPLSSWVTPNSEIETIIADANSVVAGTNDEGTKALKAVFGEKVFNYPKPLSLIRELIRQASSPGDIILDFFAGSATAAHAVMELNDEDEGDRFFIMVSHDEATEKEPDRNICRDVTAERVRRLNKSAIAADGKRPAPFAYLRAYRKPIDELRNEGALSVEEVWLSVQAMHGLPILPAVQGSSVQINEDRTQRVVYVHDLAVTGAIAEIEALAEIQKPMHVYTWTPALARDALYEANAEIHRLPSALTDRFES